MKKLIFLFSVLLFSRVLVAQQKISLIQSFPSINSEIKDNYLSHPFDVQNFKNEYYILDVIQAQVKVYDKNGRFLRAIGKKGKGPGELIDPFAFSINTENGDIIISDQGNGRISVYNNEGKYIESLRFIAEPLGLASLDKKIFVLVKDHGLGFKVNVYNSKGILINEFGGDRSLEFLDNKSLSSLLFGMGGVHSFGDKMLVYFNYLPIIYIYSVDGILINKIYININKFNSLYNNNKYPKRTGARINLKFIHMGVSYDNENYNVFDREDNLIYKINNKGEVIQRIKLDVKENNTHIFISKINEFYLFINRSEALIEIYK